MSKEIKFSLVYRDMWQSSGKYQPRVDQLVRVAPAIIDMGCFDRVETNGGAFEQVNLLYGENPNVSVRKWTAPFHKVGIQTHMLETLEFLNRTSDRTSEIVSVELHSGSGFALASVGESHLCLDAAIGWEAVGA